MRTLCMMTLRTAIRAERAAWNAATPLIGADRKLRRMRIAIHNSGRRDAGVGLPGNPPCRGARS